MKHFVFAGFVIFTGSTMVYAQRAPSSRETPFGKLVRDQALQKELNLTKGQIDRMVQIDLREMPLSRQLYVPVVADKLNFTKEQKDTFREIRQRSLRAQFDDLSSRRSTTRKMFEASPHYS